MLEHVSDYSQVIKQTGDGDEIGDGIQRGNNVEKPGGENEQIGGGKKLAAAFAGQNGDGFLYSLHQLGVSDGLVEPGCDCGNQLVGDIGVACSLEPAGVFQILNGIDDVVFHYFFCFVFCSGTWGCSS